MRRYYAATAGTGRGLHLMEELTDRWGASARSRGKTVWFEIGDVGAALTSDDADHATDGATHDATDDATGYATHDASGDVTSDATGEPEATCQVTLRHVPTLMHVAWQEHAATLLREYLLYVLDDDEDILDKHARQ